MRPLWIISELFPPDETSTAYILGEIANAAAGEYDVRVICGPEVYDARKALDTEHPFRLHPSVRVLRAQGLGIDKNTSMGKARAFAAMSLRLYRLAKRNIGAEDKVLLVTNPAPLVLLMARLRRRRRFELNILVHDVFPENTKPAGLRLPLYGLVKRLFDRAYARADLLIALGRDMAQVLRRKAGPEAKIAVVGNWADTDAVAPVPFPEGPLTLEYAGNIGRVQGLERLVRELPEGCELHFYGTGAMEETLKGIGRPNVFFHGPYFRAQQKAVLGACHIAVVTLSEGMYGLGVPSKAYNILASGRPILYFGPAEGEIGCLVRENGVGWLGWPKQLLMEDIRERGQKARALAVSSYSKETVLKQLLAVL